MLRPGAFLLLPVLIWSCAGYTSACVRRTSAIETCAFHTQVDRFPHFLALPNVVVIGSPSGGTSYNTDVRMKLLNTFLFNTVASLDLDPTPTLSQLQMYDAVLLYTGSGSYPDASGFSNSLLQYLCGGGRVVLACCATTTNYPVGSFFTGTNFVITPLALSSTGGLSLGTVLVPAHPIMAGVSSFYGGSLSYHSVAGSSSIQSGAVAIALWSNSQLLAAANAGTCRADLNMYPPSASVANSWTGDGATLMGNALRWVISCTPTAPLPGCTPTASPTSSRTKTVTPSTSVLSKTASVTATRSITPTSTRSVTPTTSVSPTPTRSPSPSPTRSVTPTASPTVTPTSSATPSRTVTPTASVTPTPSTTPSTSPTASVTPTPSTTPSTSATPTPSTTSSPSATPTTSSTPSTSVTPSVTATVSESATSSSTVTPSVTASTSATPVPSALCGPVPQANNVAFLESNKTERGLVAVHYQCLNSGTASPVDIVEECTASGWSASPALSCVATASCTGGGTWYSEGACQPCPKGAFCPGGSRIWPRYGYWSTDEGTEPVACYNADACPGSVGEVNPVSVLAGGVRKTDNCADGYTGPFCSLCVTGRYKSYNNCLVCPENPTASFVSLIIAAVVLYTVMAAGIAALPDARLDLFVSSLVTLQQLILVGRIASAKIATAAPWLAQTFTVLSVVAFDIQFARAECNTGPLTFVTVFWGTLLMMLGVGVLFFLGAVGRAACLKAPKAPPEDVPLQPVAPMPKTCESDVELLSLPSGLDTVQEDAFVAAFTDTRRTESAPPAHLGGFKDRLRRRGMRALVIFLTIMYLTVCTRVLQGLVCDSTGSQLLLRVELSTICYQGSHASAAGMMWVLLVLYCLGYPAAMVFVLFRFFRQKQLFEPETAARWGYLYRGLKPPFFWYRIATQISTFLFVLASATANSTAARIFAGCLLFEALALLLIIFWPFELVRTNIINLVTALIKTVYAVIFLAVSDSETAAEAKTAFLPASFPLACIAIGAIVLRLLWTRFIATRVGAAIVRRLCCRKKGDSDDGADYDVPSRRADPGAELLATTASTGSLSPAPTPAALQAAG